MHNEDVFASTPVAAKMSADSLRERLQELDDKEKLEPLSKGGWGIFESSPPIWKSAAHAFGFIAQPRPDQDEIPIIDVGAVIPEATLANKRVNLTLNVLRIAEYPGRGDHRILFDFYAKNQVPGSVQEVHFATTYRILEGERAGIKGFPIFIGLTVGRDGVAFRCFTVNVKNDDDEKFLSMLDSDVFKGGLTLAATAQPAISVLSGFAVGLTKAIARRNRNIPVQDFYLGLDFTTIPGGGRLAEGAYVAVQIPEKDKLIWDWDAWSFKTRIGQIVERKNSNQLIPYNYIVFGVSEYRGAE